MLLRVKSAFQVLAGVVISVIFVALGALALYMFLDWRFIIAATISGGVMVVLASAIIYWKTGMNSTL